MRIAQLAPLAESVPPKLYGGTERVVAWLVDELVKLGHDVTLFASGDSRTTGKLHPVWPRALRLGRKGADPGAANAMLLEAIAKRARDFDVIHAHIDWLQLPLLSRLGVPFMTTMHGRLAWVARTGSAIPRGWFRVDLRSSASAASGCEVDGNDPARIAVGAVAPLL
ncbi:glycosyltransferase involved in cell wall biosynthesis [Bradyrhizobium sp. CIR18]|nr:glycosyltransferase involved in cell wall biosynthesis [Bradyrhizobium sp. CIR18]